MFFNLCLCVCVCLTTMKRLGWLGYERVAIAVQAE